MHPITQRVFSTALLLLVCQQTAHAASPEISSWNKWLFQQIQQHPEVVAERENMNAQLSSAEARDQPLYNPELAAELEREGEDNNARIGVSQTLDWWDKLGARKSQGTHSRQAAQNSYQQILQQKIAETLLAINDLQTAQQRVTFARAQESQLDELLALVEQRQKTGDLGQIDAELAVLTLSQSLNESADAEAQLARTEATLKELLPGATPNALTVPETFWQQYRSVDAAQQVDQHPRVLQALAEWNATKAQTELTARDVQPDPTVGINGGTSGSDNVVGLTFSMPLNLRNDYRAEVRAASQEALSAEAHYHQLRRQQLALLEGSEAALKAYASRHQRWRSVMQSRAGNSATLLEKQWRAGDISTPDYLLTLKERGESLQAGIELESEWHRSVIEWLMESGQLTRAIQRN